MALGVLCILGKKPERLSDGCLIGFSDLELMSGLRTSRLLCSPTEAWRGQQGGVTG
jgi:hypothetical protein